MESRRTEANGKGYVSESFKKKNEIASTFHKRRCAPTGMVAGSQEGRGESMKCIAVVDSNHSLMNFKLFGKKGGSYRIDVDDAIAKEKENEYYTMHKAENAESILEWLVTWGVKELPCESVRWLVYYVLHEEDKHGYALEDYMVSKRLWRLPYFQKIDGRILASHPKENEEIWFVVNGDLQVVKADGLKSVLNLFLKRNGKLVPFHLVCQDWYNKRMQTWEKWESPIVYKWQAPSPYLVKRYEQDDEMDWHLKSAQIEYGWFVNYQSILTTKGEQTWENDYTVKAELVREWSVWED